MQTNAKHPPPRRRSLLVSWLYMLALTREFRWTLAGIAITLCFGAALYSQVPQASLGGDRPTTLTALHGAWMAMLAQPIFQPPQPWYLLAVATFYPILGALLIGEGVVRLALLMISKRAGEKEWMRVMASTFRDHIILCGLGHLGVRVLQQLAGAGVPTVVIEKDPMSKFLPTARELGAPVLISDMKEDKSLLDAGVDHARAIIVATNDDMANIEVALDARRLNPKIRVLMRLFEQAIAAKISGAISVDVAFSASALAAPVVAAMSMESRTIATTAIAGIAHTTAELTVGQKSAVNGKTVGEVEEELGVRVLCIGGRPADGVKCPPKPSEPIIAPDVLTLHVATERLANAAAAIRG